ncbi:SDR family oxidoreductase [Specibacter cremeus]|uniref:SDR family oxidoreductase n=1 Tax=Specibacter cremeus TaxID=1629051 RepID=UPI000F7A4539|nr:NAD(P)H-binding protein [Specibacter cremeus]
MGVLAVAGGTGTAGGAVVAEAAARGLSVRSISRHAPDVAHRVAGAEYACADFATGSGVAEALAGVDALVETLDARSGAALRALPVTTVAVLAAAQRAGVRRAVLLTIANAGESTFGYYRVQAARALTYTRAGMDTSVVYATQFHNLVAGIFAAGARVRVVPVIRGASFQPVAVTDVAKVLMDEALVTEPGPRSVTVGGPQIRSMKSLAVEWKASTGRGGAIVSVPLPGSFGRFLRAGRNLVPEHAVGTVTFTDWLRLESRRRRL